MRFLTARWSNLFLATYAVPEELLRPRLPEGLELDRPDGQCFVSLVAFDFLDTRVLGVPGVLSLVGFGRALAPLSDFEIEALRSCVGQRKIEPHPYLVIGERVRIKAGPMTGMEGVLVRKKSNFRVVLALDVIMQCVAVEVDADDLEPASQQACGHS